MDLRVLEYEDGKWMGAAEDCPSNIAGLELEILTI
jgi:hypothetical protein